MAYPHDRARIARGGTFAPHLVPCAGDESDTRAPAHPTPARQRHRARDPWKRAGAGGFIFSIGLPIIVLLASAHGGVIAQALPAQVVSLIIAVPMALALVGTALVPGRKRTILLLRSSATGH
jgi:hypothetical protein